jgi:Flp pilus assembly protein TadD
LQNTVLSLQQVLKANPRNIEANRMMAVLTEADRKVETLVWRERVLLLNPNSFDDRLSMAQAALLFQDYHLATNTLAGVAQADKNTLAYHNVAGPAALAAGRPDQAEMHFSESVRLDPTNPIPQVNLAVVRLHQSNTLDMAEARIALHRVIMTSTNSVLQSQIRRELIIDAVRFSNMTNAITLSKELAEQTNSVFSDKLLRLDVLMKYKSPELKPALAAYRREAATDPAKLNDLSNWQASRLSPAEALGWLQSLPMSTRTNQPAALLSAECQLQLGDWHGLQTELQSQNWGEIEFLRHAYIARSLREQKLWEAPTAEWGVALNAANSSRDPKGCLTWLLRLAADWRWNIEAEQILWTLVHQYPDDKLASSKLSAYLMAGHRTRQLMDLFNIMFKRNPDDPEIENNLAMTAMLFDAQELKPYDLAQAVYAKYPKKPNYASTYAFSLYKQGKNAEALKVMQQLTPKDLESPAIAGYYGLILKANGNQSEAKAYLDRISKAQLMPEEQSLFDKAMVGL